MKKDKTGEFQIKYKVFIIIIMNFLFNPFSFAQLDPGMIKKLVSIITEPDSAEIFVKSKGIWEYLGTSPLKKEIRIGEKEIKIIKAGYEDYYGLINSQTMKHFSAVLTDKIIFTGNPSKDIIGEWESLNINQVLEKQNYSLPAKLTLKSNGDFGWSVNYFSKPFIIKGKYTINTFTTPHLIDLYAKEIYDPKKDSYTKQKVTYYGIFKIQNQRLGIIFYDSKSRPRPLKLNLDETQSYKKIH